MLTLILLQNFILFLHVCTAAIAAIKINVSLILLLQHLYYFISALRASAKEICKRHTWTGHMLNTRQQIFPHSSIYSHR